MASFIDNPNALVGIGILVLLLLIATAVLLAVLKLKRKRGSNNQGKIIYFIVYSFYKIIVKPLQKVKSSFRCKEVLFYLLRTVTDFNRLIIKLLVFYMEFY